VLDVVDAAVAVGVDVVTGDVLSELGPDELVAAGVEVAGGGGGGLAVEVLVDLSGSVYWLSPAEGPDASATVGPIAIIDSNSTQVVVTRRERTLRVLQAMRLLAFSDLHRNREQARRLVAMAGDADVVVGAGDYATMRFGVERTIDVLSALDRPTILVPGNNESVSALWRAAAGFKQAVILHGEGTEIGGTKFFGLGAGVPPTPFPWSWDLSEEDAATKLIGCPEGAVLVVHSPPKGYVDEAFGRHLGSRSILDAIRAKHPPLVLCGHIHQCWGQVATIGATRIVNLGPEGRFFDL
jgi:uncharacterized protein